MGKPYPTSPPTPTGGSARQTAGSVVGGGGRGATPAAVGAAAAEMAAVTTTGVGEQLSAWQQAEVLEAEQRRVQNAVVHLVRSTEELQAALADDPDPEYSLAVAENETVLQQMTDKLAALATQIQALRGVPEGAHREDGRPRMEGSQRTAGAAAPASASALPPSQPRGAAPTAICRVELGGDSGAGAATDVGMDMDEAGGEVGRRVREGCHGVGSAGDAGDQWPVGAPSTSEDGDVSMAEHAHAAPPQMASDPVAHTGVDGGRARTGGELDSHGWL